MPTLDEKNIGTTKALTVREMIAKHRANPTCASCHAVMDPLGWRSRISTRPAAGGTATGSPAPPIDASGTLPDGTAINGPDDLRKALLRHPEQFVQTFTEGLLKYATGRTLEYRDMPTVRRIVRDAAAGRLPVLGDRPGHRAERAVQKRRAPAAGPAGSRRDVGADRAS